MFVCPKIRLTLSIGIPLVSAKTAKLCLAQCIVMWNPVWTAASGVLLVYPFGHNVPRETFPHSLSPCSLPWRCFQSDPCQYGFEDDSSLPHRPLIMCLHAVPCSWHFRLPISILANNRCYARVREHYYILAVLECSKGTMQRVAMFDDTRVIGHAVRYSTVKENPARPWIEGQDCRDDHQHFGRISGALIVSEAGCCATCE